MNVYKAEATGLGYAYSRTQVAFQAVEKTLLNSHSSFGQRTIYFDKAIRGYDAVKWRNEVVTVLKSTPPREET